MKKNVTTTNTTATTNTATPNYSKADKVLSARIDALEVRVSAVEKNIAEVNRTMAKLQMPKASAPATKKASQPKAEKKAAPKAQPKAEKAPRIYTLPRKMWGFEPGNYTINYEASKYQDALRRMDSAKKADGSPVVPKGIIGMSVRYGTLHINKVENHEIWTLLAYLLGGMATKVQ